eukprot:COSAG05_NODE_160_length_15590_cov_14.460848_2_plen_227_part_00
MFNRLTITIISLNAISIAVETFPTVRFVHSFFFGGLDLVFVTYYSVELALKLYAYPCEFWLSRYNQFDAFVLLSSYLQHLGVGASKIGFLRMLRALRALLALRGISFVRSLQVLVAALRTTVAEVVNLLVLLLLLVYIFGIMGFYFFAYEQQHPGQSAKHWDSLGAGAMSLFVFVTADGWTDIQDALDEDGRSGSRIFTISFMVIGHFIFINLFIGVVIQNIEQVT